MKKEKYERPIIQRHLSGLMNKFGRRGIAQPISSIDGVGVKRLVEDYGSPLFVFSENTLRKKYKEALRAFNNRYPKVQFAWSYKTNYLGAICSILHQEGAWAEVVSEFEYEKARGLQIPGDKIIVNGPYKSNILKKAVLENAMINIDNLDELYSLNELGHTLKRKINVGLRINMDTGIYPQWDRFGFNLENGQAYEAVKKVIYSQFLQLVGLHCHIGTFILTTDPYHHAAQKLVRLAKTIKDEFNILIKYLDLGGGFASKNRLHAQYLPGEQMSPSFDQYAEAITTPILLDGSFKPDEVPLLILETGRALVDEAGFLIANVVATKRLPNGKRAIILDAGVNILFTSYWYRHEIIPAQDFNEFMEDTIVYGPLCMQIDVIRESVMLPPLEKGDLVVIKPVGAYNLTQWMQFITFRPPVVLIGETQQVDIIRQKEDLNYILEKEQIPKRLLKDEVEIGK